MNYTKTYATLNREREEREKQILSGTETWGIGTALIIFLFLGLFY